MFIGTVTDDRTIGSYLWPWPAAVCADVVRALGMVTSYHTDAR
jgi:hypothetical protein